MKIKVIVFLIMIFILSINFVSAENIKIEGKIFLNNSYFESVSISTQCDENVTFTIPSEAYNINSDLNLTNKTLRVLDCNNATNISYFLPSIEESDSGFYRIERKFENLANYNYTYSLQMPVIYTINKNLSSPTNFSINYSDENNKNIDFSQNSDIYLLYYGRIDDSENNEIIAKSYRNSIFFLLLAFLLGFFVAYLIFRKEKKKMVRDNVPSYVLLEEEMKVLKIIKDNPGINQTQISKLLRYSKSKTSMIIKQLENKKLVEREKFGRSFKVYSSKTII